MGAGDTSRLDLSMDCGVTWSLQLINVINESIGLCPRHWASIIEYASAFHSVKSAEKY